MPEVTLPSRPALVVVPDIELMTVGENWPMQSDGREEGTVTPADLAAAVDAQSDPSVRSPILRLGHGGPSAGQPAFGRLQNLRLTEDGMTLVADLVGAPAWLADVLPYAWPSRSIEGVRNERTDAGRTHLLRIDALALLGVELPAISTLDDVRAVYAATDMAEANVTLSTDVSARRRRGWETTMPTTTAVAASVTTEDIRRAYYDQLGPAQDWWIRELMLEPLALIVDDDQGQLWQVTIAVADDAVSFGEPTAVRVEYVATSPAAPAPVAAGAATSATRDAPRSIVYASRTESREGVALDPAELRRNLGLAEDASDADVTARVLELAARPEAPAASTTDTPPPAPVQPGTPPAPAPPPTPPAPAPVEPPTSAVPDGAVLVSQAVLEQLQADAALGVAAARRQARDDEDRFIARHRNRLGPASNPRAGRLEASLRREYQRNPGEAEALAASHAVIAPTTAAGHDGGADTEGDSTDALYAELFGAETKGA